MSPEIPIRASIPEERVGKVHDWGEMSSYLPTIEVAAHERFLKGYFKAQRLLEEGKKVKAKRLFCALDNTTGYADFEDSSHDILKMIDIAVRGQSRWQF
jgi:hypothetical protein